MRVLVVIVILAIVPAAALVAIAVVVIVVVVVVLFAVVVVVVTVFSPASNHLLQLQFAQWDESMLKRIAETSYLTTASPTCKLRSLAETRI